MKSKPGPQGAALSPARISRGADQLFLYCFLAYTCSYLGRKDFSACIPAMIGEGLLDKTYAGYITTAYMLTYGLGQMLSGLLATRVKPKYLIGIGLMGAGLCNLTMSRMETATLMPLVWGLNGMFHSLLWAPIVRVFTDLLPAGKRERAGVNISAACSAGAVLAYLVPGLILRLAGWRVVFVVAGCVLLTAALVWVVGHWALRGYIAHMEAVSAAEREKMATESVTGTVAPPKRASLAHVFIASGLWVVLFSLICNGALRDAVESWAPTFLAERFRLDESTAALFAVFIPIISLAGPYAAEWMYRKWIHNELFTSGIMFVAGTLFIGGMFLCRDLHALPTSLLMALAVAAMFGANHMFLTVLPYHFAPMGLSAAVSGFLNSVIYLSTALFSSAYGIIAERCGWNTMMLVWLGVGAAGIIFCGLGGTLWQKKYPLVDKGKI